MSHHKLRIKQTHAHVHHTSPMPNTSWRKNLMKSNCWVINVPNNIFSVRNTVTCIGMHTITIVLLRGKQYVLSYLFCHVICNYNIRPVIHDLKLRDIFFRSLEWCLWDCLTSTWQPNWPQMKLFSWKWCRFTLKGFWHMINSILQFIKYI